MARNIAGLVIDKIFMDRKKFVALFSTGILGLTFMKVNPLNFLGIAKKNKSNKAVEVKINPLAVNRNKTGKKND